MTMALTSPSLGRLPFQFYNRVGIGGRHGTGPCVPPLAHLCLQLWQDGQPPHLQWRLIWGRREGEASSGEQVQPGRAGPFALKGGEGRW